MTYKVTDAKALAARLVAEEGKYNPNGTLANGMVLAMRLLVACPGMTLQTALDLLREAAREQLGKPRGLFGGM